MAWWSSATTSRLLDTVVNRVFHLDANRAEIDVYNVGWRTYLLSGRPTSGGARADERREEGGRPDGTGRQDAGQGDQASPPRTWPAGPSGCWPAWRGSGVRQGGQVPLPGPAPCGRTPLRGVGLSQVLRVAGGLHRRRAGGRPGVAGGRAGLNGAGKTTLLRILAGVDQPDTGEVEPGHGLKLGYYAQEHENLDLTGPCWRTCSRPPPPGRDRQAEASRLVPVQRRRRGQARRVLSGARGPGSAGPARGFSAERAAAGRADEHRPRVAARSPRRARSYTGAVILVTHDEGAVGHWRRTGSCCCPTPSRTFGARTTSTWSRSPDLQRPACASAWVSSSLSSSLAAAPPLSCGERPTSVVKTGS